MLSPAVDLYVVTVNWAAIFFSSCHKYNYDHTFSVLQNSPNEKTKQNNNQHSDTDSAICSEFPLRTKSKPCLKKIVLITAEQKKRDVDISP